MAAFTTLTGTYPTAMTRLLQMDAGEMYMYIEYAEDGGSVPSYSSADDVNAYFADPLSYYNSLASTRNYLRVPAFRHPVVDTTVTSDPPDTIYRSVLTYLGQAAAGTSNGVNEYGPLFIDDVRVYGAALVLAIDPADRTKDIVISRSYFTAAPLTRVSYSPVSVTMPISFSATVTE